MGFFHELANLADATAVAIANGQLQQGEQPAQTGGRRTRARSARGCTPCQAMADVDAARKKLGFTTGAAGGKK